MKRNSLKQIRPFDEVRNSTSRTDPDYETNKIRQISLNMLTLVDADQELMLEGIPSYERKKVREFLQVLAGFKPVSELVCEAKRCLSCANSTNGAVAVAGKALELLVRSLNVNFYKTSSIAKMLERLKVSRNGKKKEYIREQEAIDRILGSIESLELRNAVVHFNTTKPHITIKECENFIAQVEDLIGLEVNKIKSLYALIYSTNKK